MSDSLPDYERMDTADLLVIRSQLRMIPADRPHLLKVIEILRGRGIASDHPPEIERPPEPQAVRVSVGDNHLQLMIPTAEEGVGGWELAVRIDAGGKLTLRHFHRLVKAPVVMRPMDNSGQIEEWGYDDDAQILLIRFRSGARDSRGPLYRYHGVPAPVVRDFADSKSPGAFLHSEIKHNYRHEKMPEEISA